MTKETAKELLAPFISNIRLRKPEVLHEFDLVYLVKHLTTNIDPTITNVNIVRTLMNNILIFNTSNYLLDHCNNLNNEPYSINNDITYQLILRVKKSGNYNVAL